MPNQVPFNITEADHAAIQTSIQTLQTKLLPHLATLSPDDRMELPKMGDKTVGFVLKTQEYCKQNPDLAPQFLDLEGLDTGVKAFEEIRAIYLPLLQITDSLRDSMLLAGSEAYSASLQFYNSVKQAAKSRVQRAETIYTDLAAKFPRRTKKDQQIAPLN